MGNKTRDLAQQELDYISGDDPPSAPATFYVAAENTVGTMDTPGTEVAAADYERLAVTASSAWDAVDESDSEFSQFANADDWDFIEPTEDWDEVQGWSVWTAPTGGTRLYYGELNPHQFIQTGVILRIPAGSAIIRA